MLSHPENFFCLTTINGSVSSVQEMHAFGEASSDVKQHDVCEKQQPEQRQGQPLPSQGLNQLPKNQLPVDRALSSLQRLQPQTALPSFLGQQELRKIAVQQVQALCQTIKAPRLDLCLSDIDAVLMLSQLDTIQTSARIATKTVRSANVQHPSSPPAQRHCREV